MQKPRFAVASIGFITALSAGADPVTLSGRVLDTGSSAGDKPIAGVIVEVFDESSQKVGRTLTKKDGQWEILVDSVAKLAKGTTKIGKAGYSAFPTSKPISLKRSEGSSSIAQGDVYLTDEAAIRTVAVYRVQVAQSAVQVQTGPGQRDKASSIYVSLSGLPDDSKTLVFNSVRSESAPAYAELLKVDMELNNAKELESALKKKVSTTIEVVPQYEPSKKLRLSGMVSSQQELDEVVKKAGEKGYSTSKIVNDIQIGKRSLD